MTDFEEWLEIAAKHPFGHGVASETQMMLVRLGHIPEFSVPADAMEIIHSAIVMSRKGVVWFDEHGAQVGASAYQGAGERYIWVGADMGKLKGEL